MIQIHGYDFKKVEYVNKGTNDEKYYVETYDGRQLMLRIMNITKYEQKKKEHAMLERITGLDIAFSRPVEFGLCNNGKNVYQLLTWIDGEDAESVLPKCTKTEQYNIGLKAGKVFKKINSIPAPDETEAWDIKLSRMLKELTNEFNSKMELHSEFGETVLGYFKENVLGVRSQSFCHGDCNPGNIIIMPNGEIGVIDFGCTYCDPCYDISQAGWYPTRFPYFYSGLIRGHYGKDPTIEYWKAYTYYWALNIFYALLYPQWVGLDNLENGKKIVRDILDWSDNLSNPIPNWYVDNLCH